MRSAQKASTPLLILYCGAQPSCSKYRLLSSESLWCTDDQEPQLADATGGPQASYLKEVEDWRLRMSRVPKLTKKVAVETPLRSTPAVLDFLSSLCKHTTSHSSLTALMVQPPVPKKVHLGAAAAPGVSEHHEQAKASGRQTPASSTPHSLQTACTLTLYEPSCRSITKGDAFTTSVMQVAIGRLCSYQSGRVQKSCSSRLSPSTVQMAVSKSM